MRVIVASPALQELAQAVDLETRRLVLRRFPFALIYRLKAEVAEVVAIAHRRRRPDYWMRPDQDRGSQ